jgi:hypothetical protein
VNALQASTPTGPAGVLVREEGLYQFACDAKADARSAVSLTMPVRRLPYGHTATLPPSSR